MTITPAVVADLLTAMDAHKDLARQLVNKVLVETNQPEIIEIKKGNYELIENAELLNQEETLSDGWDFDVHGEHCLFVNRHTKQQLEVSLGGDNHIDNLDPYFFYNFLKTTAQFKNLTIYFQRPFNDVLSFFEALEKQGVLQRVHGVEYRKGGC